MAADWEHESFCYVTTRGRNTGRPHTIEIWFGAAGRTLYLLSGGGDRSDWVRNLRAEPSVSVRIGRGEEPMEATARVVEGTEEDAVARRVLAGKYQGWTEGAPMSTWARTSLAVALDLERGP